MQLPYFCCATINFKSCLKLFRVPNELNTNGVTQTLPFQNFYKSLQSFTKYLETSLQK